MDIKNKIIKYCNDKGLDLIGFTKCRKFYELDNYFNIRKEKGYENEFEEEEIEKRINPFLIMPEGKTIISIAFPYLYDIETNSKVYFSKYTLGMDYHVVVSKYLEDICNFLVSLGGKCEYFVDSNSLPERLIAQQCGVGFVGKNNTLITEKYGSYIFLGEIITDLIIEYDEPLEQKCGECNICLKACPTDAIKKGEHGIDNNSNLCLSYLSQRKSIENEWFSKFKGRIFGCDTCQRVCPYNKNLQVSGLQEFKPIEYMKDIDLNELINLDNKTFKEKYKMVSAGWRGKNIIKRNAMIAAFYLGQENLIDISKVTSPYIKDYYDRLLKNLQL